jgi:predicted dehydrogenase
VRTETSQTKRPLPVSVLGLGAMGQRHARVLSGLCSFRLVGAYDVSEAAAARLELRRFANEDDAIRAAEVVVVATPIEAHAGAAIRALGAGKHVLVEKPLCDDTAQADALVIAASRAGAQLFVGHSERFNPVIRALARMLRDDPLLAIELRRMGPTRPVPQGVLLNVGVHDLDLACYLGGGELVLRRSAEGVGPDAAHLSFDAACGAVGQIHVDRTRPSKERVISLITREWLYRGDLLAHRLLRARRDGGDWVEVPLDQEEPLAAQAAALAAAVAGVPDRELATGEDGARAVRLAEIAARFEPAETENLSLIGSA